jgi:hypothetical protein
MSAKSGDNFDSSFSSVRSWFRSKMAFLLIEIVKTWKEKRSFCFCWEGWIRSYNNLQLTTIRFHNKLLQYCFLKNNFEKQFLRDLDRHRQGSNRRRPDCEYSWHPISETDKKLSLNGDDLKPISFVFWRL